MYYIFCDLDETLFTHIDQQEKRLSDRQKLNVGSTFKYRRSDQSVITLIVLYQWMHWHFFSEILRQYKSNQEIELIFLTHGAYGKNLLKKIFQVFFNCEELLDYASYLRKDDQLTAFKSQFSELANSPDFSAIRKSKKRADRLHKDVSITMYLKNIGTPAAPRNIWLIDDNKTELDRCREVGINTINSKSDIYIALLDNLLTNLKLRASDQVELPEVNTLS